MSDLSKAMVVECGLRQIAEKGQHSTMYLDEVCLFNIFRLNWRNSEDMFSNESKRYCSLLVQELMIAMFLLDTFSNERKSLCSLLVQELMIAMFLLDTLSNERKCLCSLLV